jgi:hypothetical protein
VTLSQTEEKGSIVLRVEAALVSCESKAMLEGASLEFKYLAQHAGGGCPFFAL